MLYGINFAIVITNTILDAITIRAEVMPEWLRLYAMFILPTTPIVIGVGIAFIFLLDPSKKIHDARAAAAAASMDAMAIHMREAANRNDVNEAIQVAAARDMREATIRVTGAKVPQLPAPRSQSRKRSGVVVMGAEGKGAPKLAKPKKRR
jgi:hypothetical protein